MSTNKLKLNSETSSSRTNDSGVNISMFPIELFSVKSNPAKSSQILGLILTTISPSVQIYQLSAIYTYTTFEICGVFALYLDVDSAKLLANALVSRFFDYCHSLLSGIVDMDLTKLQRVQDRLACVVTKSRPFTRSVSLLHSLRRLPVKFRSV